MDQAAAIRRLERDVAALKAEASQERSASLFWLLQLYAIAAGPYPAHMAAWVRGRAKTLKQVSPPDDGSVSPAEYDASVGRLMPAIERMAEVIAQDLDSTAKGIRDGEALPADFLRQ